MALVRSQHDTSDSHHALPAYVVLPVELVRVLVPELVRVLEPELEPVLVRVLELEPELVLELEWELVLEPERVQARVLVSHLRMPPVMAL